MPQEKGKKTKPHNVMDCSPPAPKLPPPEYGNSLGYAARRLQRDKPELLAKVQTGELSAHQAARFRWRIPHVNKPPFRIRPRTIIHGC